MFDNKELIEEPKKVQAINKYQISVYQEDHTLLNVLSYAVEKSCDDIDICGYTIPHPLESKAIFRVQFKDEKKQNSENAFGAMVVGLDFISQIGEKLLESVSEW